MTVRIGMLDCEIYRRRSGLYGARIGSLMDAGYLIHYDNDGQWMVYGDDEEKPICDGRSKTEAERAIIEDWTGK